MIKVELDTRDIEKAVRKASIWGMKDMKELRKINTKVSKVYVNALRTKLQTPAKTTIRVKGRAPVTPGTLRRSIGSWTVDMVDNRVMAGPRARFLGRRVSARNDGWFAHFVEQGALPDEFGGHRTNQKTGVFKQTLRETTGRMKSEQRKLYKVRLHKYLK